MTKKRNQYYSVNFKVMVDTNVDILAESYEEALLKAKQYDVKDVVEFDTDYNDGSIAVIGVYNPKEPNKGDR